MFVKNQGPITGWMAGSPDQASMDNIQAQLEHRRQLKTTQGKTTLHHMEIVLITERVCKTF